jgi:hypothetical protein
MQYLSTILHNDALTSDTKFWGFPGPNILFEVECRFLATPFRFVSSEHRVRQEAVLLDRLPQHPTAREQRT